MYSLVQILAGIGLVIAGVAIVRAFAGAALRPDRLFLFDATIPLLVFLLLFSVTARPVWAGFGLFALLASIAYADRTKRKVLREPIVFFDVYLTVDVLLRHPQVDVLTASNWRTFGRALGGTICVVVAFLVEPPLWTWNLWPPLITAAVLTAGFWILSGPGLAYAAARFAALGATGDAIQDSAKLGFFAMQTVHVALARAERPRRQQEAAAISSPAIHRSAASGRPGPVILVQSESFFDARRLSPAVPADLLPAFDRCRAKGVQWGRLAVPGFGGNTMRTEFAVLTGLSEDSIGFDRFNPYQVFARKPVRSLAWRLRDEGYRTICIHPFDRRFYRRDIVMEKLGFGQFLGDEAFRGDLPPGQYVPDQDVAALALDLLRKNGPKTFVFAITMQNHGPWPPHAPRFENDIVGRIPILAGDPALSGFMAGLHESDRMLETLAAGLDQQSGDSLLALYGDHLPGFSTTFRRLNFLDRQSDYLILRKQPSAARRIDLQAHELADAMLAALDLAESDKGRRPGRSLAGMT